MFIAFKEFKEAVDKAQRKLDRQVYNQIKNYCKLTHYGFKAGMGTWIFTKNGKILEREQISNVIITILDKYAQRFNEFNWIEFSCADIKETNKNKA